MARPTTRRAPVANVGDAPARPAVRDFTAGAAGHVIEWDVRPVYDFLFSLSGDAGSTEDLPADDRTWLKDAKAALPADQADVFRRISETDLAVHMGSFVVERRELTTVDEVLVALEEAGPGPLLRSIFAEAMTAEPASAALIERTLEGDRSALAELETALPEWKKKERLSLLEDPERSHAEMLGAARSWAEQFRPIEDRIRAILVRDFDLRAGDRATLVGPDLIERTTGGVRWLPEPGVRRVILAPSYFSRPYNFLLAGADWRFFGYPVADDALDLLDPLAPPLSVLRLHRALGDGTRLRILKLLAERDLYLTEIAQQLELSKPTIKHHLTQLRVAGLLTVVESGAVVYYSLRRDRLDDASHDLKRFLVG
jgi:DNA-binding transcriptional ArsR family regulator